MGTSPLKRFLNRYFDRGEPEAKRSFEYRVGDSVIEEFSEFSGLAIDTIVQRINAFHRLNADEWNALQARDFSERALSFYGSSQSYVFDLLSANPRPEAVVRKLDGFDPRLVRAIAEHPGRRFLEFGGGLGVFCEIAARMGKEAHYLDVAGQVSRFATWRFEKHGLRIPFICADPGRIHIPGEYDIVFSDAVLEHLPQPLQVEASTAMGRAVRPGGVLLFLVDPAPPSSEFPMHCVVDIPALHDALQATGMDCEFGRDRFCSLWRRK